MRALPDNWRRLAERVRERRYDLRLTQTTLARDAGTSDRTIGSIERAEQTTYHAATLRSIARALRWTPDSIDRVLADDGPLELHDDRGSKPDRFEELREEIAQLRREVEALRSGRDRDERGRHTA